MTVLFYNSFVNIAYHIDWFADIEPSFYPWNKSHLIVLYDPFNKILNFILQHFVEDFWVFIS